MNSNNAPVFRVVDLKQYIYCPRLIYYYYCLPKIRPVTYKMEAGLEAQDDEESRAARRSLRTYGLKCGTIETNVYLESPSLGLRGIVDLVITTNETSDGQPEVIPVDYKLSNRQMGLHFKLQLLAYGLLLHEVRKLPVNRGFLYAIPRRKAGEVLFTPALRNKLAQALRQMQDIVSRENMPNPVKKRQKCEVCEFRRFCNDVI
ncbi:MAG: CRISPR-associated protein Cas4 [Chloroflexi bacterium]|nr:MAG: CRISPR-associated protein Cas4 [Chloroflexota bacterium]